MNKSENSSPHDKIDENSTVASRRNFLRNTGIFAAGGGLSLGTATSVLAKPKKNSLAKRDNFGLRQAAAKNIRYTAALNQSSLGNPDNRANSDELSLPNFIGSFTKALPHDNFGEVDPSAYRTLLDGLASQNEQTLASVPLGGVRKLANPQASLAFSLVGADSHALFMPPAPSFSSAETAAEMGELYLHALLRDVPFDSYHSAPEAAFAADQLNLFSDFRGPKTGGAVTPGTLFRGSFAGDLVGNYVSQFLLKDVPQGAGTFIQRYRVPVDADDHMTNHSDWLNIQRGGAPTTSNQIDSVQRYIATARDLGEYVHTDYTYQTYLQTALQLLGMGAPVNTNNPYRFVSNQGAFVTFGAAEVLSLVGEVGLLALKAAWYQKWQVHRRIRPEAFGGRVHFTRTGEKNYPINVQLFDTQILDAIELNFGGDYWLPMAYPEGSPTHPAYPAGHAVIAGACVTVLKTLFDGDFVIPDPVEVDPGSSGTALRPYAAGPLTVRGELDKLANNIAIGRNLAGVHWRTDGTEGILLGEQVAIQMLRDVKLTYPEFSEDFQLVTFEGDVVTI
jgi:hypothetical protein